jgi:hypothetical protein
MSNAKSSMAIVLKWGGSTIGEVKDIGGPNQKVDTYDTTHYMSPGSYREFMASFIDGGEITVKGNMISDDATQEAFLADFQNRQKREMILLWPANIASLTFDAVITGYDNAQALDGVLEFNATLKISGKVTQGYTASAGVSALTGIRETGASSLSFTPLFLIGQMDYVTTVDSASTWVKFTPTAASHTITIEALGVKTSVASGALSGEIALDENGTVTKITIKAVEVNKAPKVYTIYVGRLKTV